MPNKHCPVEDCDEMADTPVLYNGKVIKMCYDHAYEKSGADYAEYVEHCPNCGCVIPVN